MSIRLYRTHQLRKERCRVERLCIVLLYLKHLKTRSMASVAIRLSASSHGKGYGTEALQAITKFCFEETELQRLWAEVDTRNIASQKMLEKCGYTREGLIRQGKMVNAWCDYYIYGILSSDGR